MSRRVRLSPETIASECGRRARKPVAHAGLWIIAGRFIAILWAIRRCDLQCKASCASIAINRDQGARASLTIRKLDETSNLSRLRSPKRPLRGEEVRDPRELIQGRPEFTSAPSQPPASANPVRPAVARRCNLSPPVTRDHRRRHRRLHGRWPDPRQERHIHVRFVLPSRAAHSVTPLAATRLSNERCSTDLFDPERIRCGLSSCPLLRT